MELVIGSIVYTLFVAAVAYHAGKSAGDAKGYSDGLRDNRRVRDGTERILAERVAALEEILEEHGIDYGDVK
jgi:hypothetical protein